LLFGDVGGEEFLIGKVELNSNNRYRQQGGRQGKGQQTTGTQSHARICVVEGLDNTHNKVMSLTNLD
jgi:hypothetical protein